MKRIFKSIVLIFMLVILLTGCTSSDKYMKEISLDDFKEKMANKETFALYVGNENCSHCISYLPTLKSVLKEYKITIYHLDNSKLSKKEYNEFNEYISISGTPTIAFITNGEEETKFKQVMSLYTKVAMIKKIPAGDQVGYGLTYTAKEDEYIATLPIGYADGFIRKNQGRKVYINGKYYEIVGRVCMDQMMVRVDENVKIGDQVEIFGEHISLESMAKDLDTISYEVLCLISKRVPRVYVQDGQVKELL